jgi:chemotaxis signal transduction protein/truncated hemoglobin YjbI
MSELAIVDNSDQIGDDFDQIAIDKEQLVTMIVEDQMFGVPILQVQDIVEPRLIAPVPLAPSAIAGVMNLRGRIVTVINLRRCLGVGEKPGNVRGMGITVEYRGDLYTLLVDSIGDVRDLPRRDFEKPPATLDEKLRRLSTGVFRLPEDLLVVLDIERVLDTEILMKTPPVVLKRRLSEAELATKEKVRAIKEPDPLGKSEEAEKAPAPEPKASSAPKPELEPAEISAKKEPENVVKFPDPEPAPDAPAAEDLAPQAFGDSLFERIGGDDAVEAAVDIFYSKVMADELLKPFFGGIDMDRQAFMQRIFLTGAFGGPQAYTGRSLREAHKGLVEEKGLGEAHFAAVAGHLQATLKDLDVSSDLIDEVMTIAASTHDDVLNL